TKIHEQIPLDPHKVRAAAANVAGNVAGNVANTMNEVNVNAEAVKRQLKKVRRKRRNMIYLGRFLVQERHLMPGQNLNSESDTASRSKLVSRWKEYAVFMRQTANPSKPAVLYFYASVNQGKLSRRSQRKWSHSLEYKIKLDSSYGISIFSILNFSIALSRFTDHGTRVLIIQSSSENSVFDLACILMAASQGYPDTVMPLKLVLDVLYLDLKIELDGGNSSCYLVDNPLEPVEYKELKSITASSSSFCKQAAVKTFDVISKLSAPPIDKKLTFAWIFPEYSHVPFWLTSSLSNFYPLTKLNKLIPSSAILAVIHPEPTCFAGPNTEAASCESNNDTNTTNLKDECDDTCI
ncbi:hypothetical protein FF38_02064, partial [Lucilia cuprina]